MSPFSRRRFLQLTGALSLGLLPSRPGRSSANMWNQIFSNPPRDISPLTPNDSFYITSYRTPPFVPAEQWQLSIHGKVDRPFTLSYPELVALPSKSEIVTLECVGNGIAGEAIGTAQWEGVSLKVLLDQAGVDPLAYDVIFRSADGYSDSIRIDQAMRDEVLVAYKMNGVPLPLGHGFPARMIVPGYYGMKHVQWLTHIELTEKDFQGYYQRKGWVEEATVKTMTWISDPQTGDSLTLDKPVSIKGLAFAGSRGIRLVELSTDGGTTWQPTQLAPALSPYSWVFWKFTWVPPKPVDYRILARATDSTGTLQSALEQGPFPDGASGLQELIVSVT